MFNYLERNDVIFVIHFRKFERCNFLIFVFIPMGVLFYFIIHGDDRKNYYPQRLEQHNNKLKKVFLLWIIIALLIVLIPEEYILYQSFGMMEYYQPNKK